MDVSIGVKSMVHRGTNINICFLGYTVSVQFPVPLILQSTKIKGLLVCNSLKHKGFGLKICF